MRGCIQSKDKDAVIKEATVDGEMLKHFDLGTGDEKQDHFHFYADGLVVGAKEMEWFSIREQRRHYDGGFSPSLPL